MTQGVEVVVAYVAPAHTDRALGDVVQACDEVDVGLRGSGTADDADGLAAGDVKVDAIERLPLGMLEYLKLTLSKSMEPSAT